MKNLTKKLLVLLVALMFTTGLMACDFNITLTESTSSTSITTLTTSEESTTTIFSVPTTHTTTQTTVEETTTTTTFFRDYSKITIVIPDKVIYQVNESLDLTGLVVTYYDQNNNPTVLTSSQYTVSTVDMSTNGIKYVEVSYLTYTALFTIEGSSTITTTTENSGSGSYVGTYYEGINDSSAALLESTLHSLLQSTKHGVSYGDARYILDETDRDPNNPSNVILVYTGASISGIWDGTSWNREHVWPKSFLPDTDVSNNQINTASDLHNLKPSNVQENSYRSNKYFSAYDSTSIAYEPRDEVKGDVARIMFYMAVMYDMELVNTTPSYLQMGMLDELLIWHEQDPIDAFEMNRNDVIFSYQENRNPFIDHPEWVEIIWG